MINVNNIQIYICKISNQRGTMCTVGECAPKYGCRGSQFSDERF